MFIKARYTVLTSPKKDETAAYGWSYMLAQSKQLFILVRWQINFNVVKFFSHSFITETTMGSTYKEIFKEVDLELLRTASSIVKQIMSPEPQTKKR
mgnify:CR=1 FL=1